MAPIITEGFRAIGKLPDLFDFELPKIKKKDDRYNYNHHYGNQYNIINQLFIIHSVTE